MIKLIIKNSDNNKQKKKNHNKKNINKNKSNNNQNNINNIYKNFLIDKNVVLYVNSFACYNIRNI